jgi:hypothetical protein
MNTLYKHILTASAAILFSIPSAASAQVSSVWLKVTESLSPNSVEHIRNSATIDNYKSIIRGFQTSKSSERYIEYLDGKQIVHKIIWERGDVYYMLVDMTDKDGKIRMTKYEGILPTKWDIATYIELHGQIRWVSR